MKKLYRILNTFLWCSIGVFFGDSIYRFYDYKTHPGLLYELQSAPWYTGIVLQGIFTAVIVAGILIVMHFLKKKME